MPSNPEVCQSDRASIRFSAVALQWITVAWMTIECSTALYAAARSGSAALLAFGLDSFIEFLSAIVVLLQFGSTIRIKPDQATRVAAVLLYGLAIAIAMSSIIALLNGSAAETSPSGIAITTAALLLMPVLAWLKRRKAQELNNFAMAADAIQSATCAYLAAVTLTSLAANAVFHVRWLDPVAALFAVPLIVREANRSRRGESCGCC